MAIKINGDNTSATPGITGSDTDTGISFGTDEVSINTGGTERVKVDSSGNVGIGTSTPSGKLHILSDAGGATGRIIFDTSISSGYETSIKQNDTGLELQAKSNSRSVLFSTGSTPAERMRILGNGAVCVNTTSNIGSTKFCVEADTTTDNPMSVSNTRTTAVTDYAIIFYRAGSLVGSVQTSLTATSYVTSSDYRLKENVVDLDGAINRVKQLAPKRFNFIADANTTVDGFLAHEAQAVVPEAVTGTHDQVDDDGNPVMQGIDQSKLVPLLTAALQEAIAKIETLETKVAALEAN